MKIDMDLKTFAELVEQMRNTQDEYFRTRSASALNRDKILERCVDDITANILDPERIKNQTSLF